MAEVRRKVCWRIVAALAVALSCATHARADTVTASTANGFARLLFTLTPSAHATTNGDGGVLTIGFDRPVTLDPAALTQRLPAYLTSARVDADAILAVRYPHRSGRRPEPQPACRGGSGARQGLVRDPG